ncbi:TetR/AcrR family transcriptional regulator [Singulisphaera sp. PoT]|uniref:TetR/AcrR family transcriptional regulator n=1 Tax=Singulisphaera sp. PoT TaxID=3411797 RepID=UPI003BF54784
MAERVDVGLIRRAQIVEAACRVIHRKGIQGTSLAEIEQEAGISRGVLTYHFPSKEDITLAVFDATIERLKAGADADFAGARSGRERLDIALDFVLNRKPTNDEFDTLNYTFLAQMSHREDFRTRLAAEYAEIRSKIAEDLEESARQAGLQDDELQALAAIVHGALSGLVMQVNVDPQAIDRAAVLRTLKAILKSYLGEHQPGAKRKARHSVQSRSRQRARAKGK